MEQLTKNQAVATSQEAVQNQNEPQLRDENAHNDKSVHGVLNPTYQAGLRRDAVQPESVNFCVMEAIKLCRLDTSIIFIEARINLSRFVVTGCAAKTSATVTFPSLNLISLFAFCFNIWLNGVAS